MRTVLIALALAVLASLPAQAAGPGLPAARRAALADEALLHIDTFMTRLKADLMAALRAGGPAQAIGVCKQVAPAIAAEVSRISGWRVGRTSHKLRNPANAPDAWERAVLERFLARQAQGGSAREMEFAEVVVDAQGRRWFRLMKAIPTGGICLRCHGQDIDPATRRALAEAYPNDQATGFAPGQLRGAFTLAKPLDGANQ